MKFKIFLTSAVCVYSLLLSSNSIAKVGDNFPPDIKESIKSLCNLSMDEFATASNQEKKICMMKIQKERKKNK